MPAANLEALNQAASILRAVIDANDNGEGGYDLAPALRVVAKLIYDAEADDRLAGAHSTKLLEAGGIVTACIVTHTTAHRFEWDLSWPLYAVARLLDDVIAERQPARGQSASACVSVSSPP